MREVNASSASVNLSICTAALEQAQLEGVDVSDLEWRVGKAQNVALFGLQLIAAGKLDPEDSFAAAEALRTGSFLHGGLFMGMRIVVDPSLPADVIRLVQLRHEQLVEISHLAVPIGFEGE